MTSTMCGALKRPASLLAVLVLTGCRRSSDGAASADAMAAGPPVEASAVTPPVIVTARCGPLPGGARLADAKDLELGDEVPFGDGYALGLVHRTAAGRVMALARLDREVTAARVVDLGVTPGDAPPPHVARLGDDLLVAGYTSAGPAGSDARELTVLRVTAGGDVTRFASIPQQRDDSLEFDLGSGLVAWDETTKATPPRGSIHVAPLSADGSRSARDLSPPDSDAEMPRVVAGGAGYFVLWMARGPERIGALDAPDATGEARTCSWLEEVNVDATGAPTGPTRHLTSTSGHVSAYDVEALGGDARPSVLVVARDDGEAIDGSGGALLRVRVRADGADPPLVLPGDGLGRGAPSLVDGPLPWIAWVGPHEELRLLPLDAAGLPLASSSAEPLLDDALPLAMRAGPAGEERMLVAFPGADPSATLRLFACTR
jgi:hypothetical protein